MELQTELLVFANWSTLVVCMVLKFPQILSVMAAKSAEGLSLGSLLLEVTGFLVFLRYHMYYEYPMETYVEYPILIAQDAVLLLFILYYSGSIRSALSYSGMAFGLWNILVLKKWIIDIALNLCTLISASSKFLQLQHLWRTQDSGQASALTWIMATYTCATRIFTTVMTTGDIAEKCLNNLISQHLSEWGQIPKKEEHLISADRVGMENVLVRFIVMLILNCWVVFAILKYRKKPDVKKKED